MAWVRKQLIEPVLLAVLTRRMDWTAQKEQRIRRNPPETEINGYVP